MSDNSLIVNPIVKQEAKSGTKLLAVTEDIMVNVSEWKGEQRVEIRRWYQGKDKLFHRSKNGLSIPVDVWNDILTQIKDIEGFIQSQL